MVASPIRSWLYRSARGIVICALLGFSVAHSAPAQVARKAKKTSGPRALGLVELSSDGKARLLPVCILIDGKFYDAGVYKASPVPFALWSGTVYEGEKTGVPQGLFTVSEAGHAGNDVWFGVGKWAPAGSQSKARNKKKEDAKPKFDEDEGPPKLRRPEPPRPSDSSATASTEQKSAPGASSTPAPAGGAEGTSDSSASTASNDEDPNRPVLKRGKSETLGAERPQAGASTGVPRRPAVPTDGSAKKKSFQLIPAISDAGGPDPRPYTYDLKPSEALAGRAREAVPAASAPARKPIRRAPAKAPQPKFDHVQFRAFDLWNTNEPVFVLSATVERPPARSTPESPDPNTYVTVVAKSNIYDELHQLYAGVTDARHLDETPRLELIDAVDADGDGRGELLFRTTSDAGKAWAVYRAGADQLFPLFEGTPPENKPPAE